MSIETAVFATPASCTTDEDALGVRIRAEFAEMPGLNLTVAQAARLFAVEPVRCERALRDLVRRGGLWTDGHVYCRALLPVDGIRRASPTRRPR
jgi:hypothetical protein